MKMQDFVLSCLGAYEYDMALCDQWEEDFDVSIDDMLNEDDIKDLAGCGNLTNAILSVMADYIICKYAKEFGVEEERFDYYINARASDIYVKNKDGAWEEVYCYDDIKRLLTE